MTEKETAWLNNLQECTVERYKMWIDLYDDFFNDPPTDYKEFFSCDKYAKFMVSEKVKHSQAYVSNIIRLRSDIVKKYKELFGQNA